MPTTILPAIKRLDLVRYYEEFKVDVYPRWLKGLSGHRPPTISWEDNLLNLTDWSAKRIRFHRNGVLLYNGGSADVNIAASLYLQALEHNGHSALIDKFKLYDVVFDKKLSKELSVSAKKLGTTLDTEWRKLVDLDRLSDYLPYSKIDEFREDIVDWVQRSPKHTWDGDEELWYKIFDEEASKAFEYSGVTPDKRLTVDQFFDNGDIWATSGSGYEPDLEKVRINDKDKNVEIEVKKNKWALRWATSKYKLKRLLFKRRKQMCKAVQKSELTKLRAVISSDLSLYLKMSYISTFLDQIFSQRKDSTLWLNKKGAFNLWQSMAPDGTVRMPLDQSEFDKNVTLRQVKILLHLIKRILVNYKLGEEVEEIMDLIIYALDGGHVYGVGDKIEITNGILSGWRWTAMLDTMVNIVELKMGLRYCREHGQKVDLRDSNSQGDDVWMKLGSYDDAFALWYSYKSFGLDVNPKKFFVDTKRDEYLRRVLDQNVITGYPARSVASICFRNPIQEREPPGPQRVRSNFGKWKLFAERMNYQITDTFFFQCYLRDSRQSLLGTTNQDIVNWTFQDVMYGGIGLGHNTADILDLEERQPEYDNLDLFSLPGAAEWLAYSAKYDVSSRSAFNFIMSTLSFKPHYSLPAWVKYVYTYEHVDNLSVPYGLETTNSGTIAVGVRAKRVAYHKKWRWYTNFESLFTVKQQMSPSIGSIEHLQPIKEFTFFSKYMTSAPRVKRPELQDGITMTLAALSDTPEKVFKFIPPRPGKPKRWLKDFYTGKLKAKVSPVNGWGTDVCGYIADSLLNAAITYFLNTSKATMDLWNSLLANVDRLVIPCLETLKIRVIE